MMISPILDAMVQMFTDNSGGCVLSGHPDLPRWAPWPGGVRRRWVGAHHPVRASLHGVDAYVGLTEADFAQVRHWLGDRPVSCSITYVRRTS
jgi:hypothetical protein